MLKRPDRRIYDIWDGNHTLQSVRNNIFQAGREGSLSYGAICSQHEKQEFCDSQHIEGALLHNLKHAPGLTLRLDIINKCNLRCVMCHYNSEEVFKRPTKAMSVEDMARILDDIGPYTKTVMLSCGDEPLLNKAFSDIVSHIADTFPHIEIEFCTNAMLLTAEIRSLIMEKGVHRFIFSIDGVTKTTVESIRIGANYERIVGNILALRDLRRSCGSQRPSFVINYVLLDSNIHEAPLFVEMAKDLGAETVDFRHAVPSIYFDDSEQMLKNNPSKFNFYRRKILEASRTVSINVLIPPAFETTEEWHPCDVNRVDLSDFKQVLPDSLGKTIVNWSSPSSERYLDHRLMRQPTEDLFSLAYCDRPFSEIMIIDQEIVKPCAWYRTDMGRLNNGKPISEIFWGDRYRQLRWNMLNQACDPGCEGCPVKGHYLPTEIEQKG